jgi:uncharacterized protein (TIGR00255 family)
MSIQSMTGFGKAQTETENYIVSVEVKSVNNRFKDFRFKMPSHLNSVENELKKEMNEFFSRGTFDIFINIKKSESKSKFDDLDTKKINSFLDKVLPILKEKKIEPSISVTEFLRSEFYTDLEEEVQTQLHGLVFSTFKSALKELRNSREQEGSKLVNVLIKHLESFKQHFSLVAGKADFFKTVLEEKLQKKVEEYKNVVAIDQGRLLQEVVFYLEKMDIHEEINRTYSHLEKFQNLLKSNNEVGRQIDFFIQELNRETNTMGSKSSSTEISEAVVQMKVQLEKMREQGLNIE